MSKLNQLKNNDSDRMKVLAWLKHIKEDDQRCVDEVINDCKANPEARAYYLMRYEQDVREQHLV